MSTVRPFRWHNLPLAQRLAGRGVSLDTRTRLTLDRDDLLSALLAALPVGLSETMPVYVLHRGKDSALAQLRHARGEQHAYVSYLAPSLEHGADKMLWLAVLDGLTHVAGQRGASDVIAEVEEETPAVAILRQSNFAIYSRQDIWYRPPGDFSAESSVLRDARSPDAFRLTSLYDAIVPSLLQQVEPLPTAAGRCYILDGANGIEGAVAAYLGGLGALIEIYLHPEARNRIEEIINGALVQLSARTRPIYCRVRHYEVWSSNLLMDFGFEPVGSQVVMVRHTAARVDQRVSELVSAIERGALLTTSVRQAFGKKAFPTNVGGWTIQGLS